MSSYAVLGATGQIGGSILELLLRSPDNKVHAYVRSKRKLLAQNLELESKLNLTIFEGSITDTQVLKSCVQDTKAVFLAAGASDNVPGCSIAQEQTSSVVQALKALRIEGQNRLPQLIILSSASLEDHLIRDLPWAAQKVMKMAASHVYVDLRMAETYLRSQDWIKQVYIKPGGLVHDRQRGHVLTTRRQETFLSFLDLAAGMIEVADEESETWNSKNVSVVPAESGTRVDWRVPYLVSKGLLWHFMPSLYPYLGPWLP